MSDIASPAGFDLATVLTGSGLTLLVSAGIVKYSDRVAYSPAELYGATGAGLAAVGLLVGLLLVAAGYR